MHKIHRLNESFSCCYRFCVSPKWSYKAADTVAAKKQSQLIVVLVWLGHWFSTIDRWKPQNHNYANVTQVLATQMWFPLTQNKNPAAHLLKTGYVFWIQNVKIWFKISSFLVILVHFLVHGLNYACIYGPWLEKVWVLDCRISEYQSKFGDLGTSKHAKFLKANLEDF